MLNPVAATESLTRTPYCTPRVSSALVNRLSRVYASAPKYHEPRVAVHCCNLCSWGHVARPKESDSATAGNVARPLHREGDVNMYVRGQGPEIEHFIYRLVITLQDGKLRGRFRVQFARERARKSFRPTARAVLPPN